VSCLAVVATLLADSAGAEVASVNLGSGLFVEPASESSVTVITPALSVSAKPSSAFGIQAGYEADIVSGASEAVKVGRLGSADIVSAATKFSDTRHVANGGFTLTRENTSLAASYAYGTESDYRSNSITVSAATDFLQRNTQIELSYARGFDKVCTSNYRATDEASARLRLDSSSGCFTDDDKRAKRDVNLDNFQVGWTQAWTPVFSTQLVFTAALQNGFLENPYRAVVIGAGDEALENHPDNRARAAIALRGKYYVKSMRTALGIGARVYRDTWDVFSQTYEVEAERYMLPWLSLLVHGRFYDQSAALFWSDDYTGGEPVTGPRGQYWTGDRELSPLQSYLVGGRLLATRTARPNARVLGMFLKLSAGLSLDVMKTDLEEFTWGGATPDDTWAFISSLGIAAAF
jgi:hypothetical protein